MVNMSNGAYNAGFFDGWSDCKAEYIAALKWALAFVRLPMGVDPEEWARKYNEVNELLSGKEDKDASHPYA